MIFANNMDRDKTQQNAGPDFRSILFETRRQNLLETGCFAWDALNSEDKEIMPILPNCPRTFGGH